MNNFIRFLVHGLILLYFRILFNVFINAEDLLVINTDPNVFISNYQIKLEGRILHLGKKPLVKNMPPHTSKCGGAYLVIFEIIVFYPAKWKATAWFTLAAGMEAGAETEAQNPIQTL